MKYIWSDPHVIGNFEGNERSEYTRNERRIIHNTDADDFHGEDDGGNRCTEDRREGGTHATHNEDAAVTVIKPEPPSKLVSDASAELQCGSLTSRRTTEKMGDHGRDKDERCHFKRQFGFGMNG